MKKKSLFGTLAFTTLTLLTMLYATACTTEASDTGSVSVVEEGPLKFDPSIGVEKTLVMADGKEIKYYAYEHIYFVTNVEDSTYQYLNFYVPESVMTGDQNVPILLRTYVGGYMAARASEPNNADATGRALAEGYVLCVPGARGGNSFVERGGEKVYTGRAPRGLLDLKAAVRYLKYNDAIMPGDANRIFTDGTSAGGAMSSLLGSTGNSPVYDAYFKEMGVADATDDVFAAICYCPIIDLDHADIAYEWLYQCTNDKERKLSPEQKAISSELAAAYPAYLNSLGLKDQEGNALTDANFLDYVKGFLIQSAQRAKNEGYDIPDNIGVQMNEVPFWGGRTHPGEIVVDIDMPTYLNYIVTTQPLKTPPSFDAYNVLTDRDSPENQVFGDATGSSVNFTTYSHRKATKNEAAELDADLATRVKIMNPMNFVTDGTSTKAQHWFIRHGARDRDTSFPVPVSFATLLMNNGYDVDFALPWNRPHSGDYNLDDMFRWMKETAVK